MEEAKTLLIQINSARMNPQGFIYDIKQQITQFDGPRVIKTSKGQRLKVAEGKYVWTDAVIFLEDCKPRQPLLWCPELCYAASQYQTEFNKGIQPNPFNLLKQKYNYNGNISFNISQCQAQQTLRETVVSMIIDDGDTQRGNRNTIFDTKFTHFGGYVTKKGNLTIAVLFFADIGDFKIKIPGQTQSYSTSNSHTTSSPANSYLTPLQMINNGKQLVYELNAIRRDPRKLIPLLKSQISNFKQNGSLSKNGFSFKTQQGKIPYLELIGQLQQLSVHPLPALYRSDGLSIATTQQVNQLQLKSHVHSMTTNHNMYLRRYTKSSENTNNFIMNRTEGDKIIDLLIFALVDDGDYKRSVRRKLLNPTLKHVGAAVGSKFFAVDVCESCEDNRQQVDSYLRRIEKDSFDNLSNKVDSMKVTYAYQKQPSFGASNSSSTTSYTTSTPSYNYTSSYHPPSNVGNNFSNNFSTSSSSSNFVTTSNIGGSNPYTYGSTLDHNFPQSPRFKQGGVQRGTNNKVIGKKTTKSSTSTRNGKTYKKIITKIQYEDGTISQTQQQEIVN